MSNENSGRQYKVSDVIALVAAVSASEAIGITPALAQVQRPPVGATGPTIGAVRQAQHSSSVVLNNVSLATLETEANQARGDPARNAILQAALDNLRNQPGSDESSFSLSFTLSWDEAASQLQQPQRGIILQQPPR